MISRDRFLRSRHDRDVAAQRLQLTADGGGVIVTPRHRFDAAIKLA